MDKHGQHLVHREFQAYIGKFEPKTGKFTEYPSTRGPAILHTPIFDQKGTLWFTLQAARHGGPADPGNGDVKNGNGSHAESEIPYGMVVPRKGVPFFVEFGANKIASMRSGNNGDSRILLPDENARPRRVAITSDDVLYYSDYAAATWAASIPKPEDDRRMALSRGPKSRPYAITIMERDRHGTANRASGRIRSCASTRRQRNSKTWVIPAGGGVVRNMMHFC